MNARHFQASRVSALPTMGSYRTCSLVRARSAPATLLKAPMGQPSPQSAIPGDPGWDIAFTRICRDVAPHVAACLRELTRRFQAIGLHCDLQSRQTPRGMSTLLAVVGQRGLLFIVDITLVDGMAVDRCRGAALDVRLLDACGDTVAHCAAATASEQPPCRTSASEVIAAAGLARSANSVFVMAIGHFALIADTAQPRG